MPIATDTGAFSGPYAANGVTVAFPFEFEVLATTEVAVMLIDADGVETTADPSDYTVTLNHTAPSDGTVTFTSAPETGYSVVPIIDLPFTNETQFVDGSGWKASPVNNVNDRAVLRDQVVKRDLGRGLKVPFGEDVGVLPSETARAGKYLAFDASGDPVASAGTGGDTGLREDLAADTGATLVGTRQGISVQASLDALGAAGKCLIVPIQGQSLTIGRSPQVTTAAAMPENLLMPVGGPEWPSMTSPAPTAVNTRPVVPANFASFVRHVQPSGVEGLAPGMAYQLAQAGYTRVIAWCPGVGGQSIGTMLAGGTQGAGAGPYHANLQAFLYHAVKWARAEGLDPVIAPVFNQGHSDADALNDGGAAGSATTQAQYLAGLTKLYRDIRLACSLALGTPWTGTLWVTPLLTAAGASFYTLAGRKQVVAAQLQAASGSVAGIKLLPPYSQFAPLFEGDLIHPAGQAFRYYGEVIGAMLAQSQAGSARAVPYITAKSVISATQVKLTFSEAVEINTALAEATTAGVKGGLEAYTSGGVQIPLTAAANGTASNEILITMASTATFSVVRNGLTQETTGAATLMPRTRVASPTPIGTAQDGTALYAFSTPQEF